MTGGNPADLSIPGNMPKELNPALRAGNDEVSIVPGAAVCMLT